MRRANVPVTWGAAILVPLRLAYVLFGKVEIISTPGATQSITKFAFEKYAGTAFLFTAPTDITSTYAAGYEYSKSS